MQSIKEFQDDKYATHYELENGSVFMLDQYKKSITNFALNIILDYSKMSPEGDEIVVQCYALGEKNRTEINLFSLGKSTIKDLHAHLFVFSKNNNCDWKVEEPIFL